ncbi:uncharacterized protein LOC132714204 isoform X2 [Ruditapes philippinarum]|uniref:uncharacterized protein LOC132714204 isoform X2 n=1 Tax=Ruditapes philippinarum TaxID=129788 RepID=UPI00295BB0A4|nr:uncharacterized protein LOC132714204 isoform X2 [Ruditapes philippinarum]
MTWESRDQEEELKLTRIKTQLSDRKSPIKAWSPLKSPVGGNRQNNHSPLGKYRKSTPPYLPRLETPPDQRRKGSKLRGNRYEVVPPVRDARGHDSRHTDYDSWGEESDDEPDVDPGHYMPYPHQYAAPPQVVFGAPFPVFYPPPPPPAKSQRKRRQKTENDYDRPQNARRSPGQSRQPLAERYEDVNRSLPLKSKKKQNQRVHFSQPQHPMNGYMGYPGFPTYIYPQYYSSDDFYGKGKKDGRYKYIDPRDTPYSPSEMHGNNVYNRFKDEPDRLLAFYMKDHPLFSENFVTSFVNDALDEFIPDIMIDALNEIGRSPSTIDSLFEYVRDDILDEDLHDLTHDIVRTTLNELVDEKPRLAKRIRYMLYSQTESDPLESFLTRLLNDAVQQASEDIVKETVREMARDYVEVKHNEIVFDDLFQDYMEEVGPSVIEDALIDLIAEDFIRDVVIESELEEELPEIAKSVLTHYDTKVLRRELKEVSSQAGDRLMESIMLDYILNLVSRQGNVWGESEYANKFMDDMMSSILLEQLLGVTVSRRKTVNNKSLKKLHEKLVTDAALDVCLQQLTASLDEDLLDVDEYEQGINQQSVFPHTPYSKMFSKMS